MRKMSSTAAAVKRRAALLEKMSDEEYFCRPEFATYLADVLSAVVTASRNSKLTFRIIAVLDDTTAFTDGDEVTANLFSPIVRKAKKRAEKFDLIVGTVTHECGHILFTDFNAAEKYYKNFLKKGILLGSLPTEIETELVADKQFRKFCLQYLQNLDNIFEDSFIEYMLKMIFKGYVASCLKKTRRQVMLDAPTLDELFARVESGQLKLSLCIVTALFSYAFNHHFNCADYAKLAADHPAVYEEFVSYTDKIKYYADRLEKESGGDDRFRLLTRIFETLYPLLKEEYEERKEESEEGDGEGESGEDESSSDGTSAPSEGSSGSSSGSGSSETDSSEKPESSGSDPSGSEGDGSDPEGESEGSPSEASSDSGSSSEDDGPSGEEETSGSGKSSGSSSDAGDGSESGSDASPSSGSTPGSKHGHSDPHGSDPVEDLEKEMEKMRRESGIADMPVNRKTKGDADPRPVRTDKPMTCSDNPDDLDELARAELEAEKNVSERMRTMDVFNEFNRRLVIKYDREISSIERAAYLSEYRSVAAFANRTVRLLESVLKERQREGWITGQLCGKRFDAKSAYLENGRVFKRELVPEGAPKVAFGILIDESGSMHRDGGRRISMARKTAIALEDILRRLDVPRLILGHTADEEEDYSVTINKYVEFDSYRDDDRFRLTKAQARCENHDACAIAYIGERMMERSEEKVLIVLSDGEPAATGFWGADANQRTKEIVDSLRKKGVTVIAAALGGSYGELVTIYGAPYIMDIESLEDLPVQVTKLVKKYVVKRRA